jgi:dTDP-glucose 4,6-dehydratase
MSPHFPSNPLAADLDLVLSRLRGLWEELRGRRLFITGGTGFFGCWLLESFAWANARLGLGARAVVLTRNASAFCAKAPHLAADPAIRLVAGEVRDFDFPAGEFSHVIHAATESGGESDPLELFDTIVLGTRRVLAFAAQARARRFLFTSSGAVYGPQPADLARIPEDYVGGPDPASASSSYGGGKRAAELLCALYHRQHGLQTVIARGFAFVGPHLALDKHFAIGNFIGDALRGGPIRIQGDGTPRRSYLYAADLAIWLWTILFRGQPCRPYNVGSDREITIRQLAQKVRQALCPSAEIRIAAPAAAPAPPRRYVPATARAASELGLGAAVPLLQAIQRTAAWYSGRANAAS